MKNIRFEILRTNNLPQRHRVRRGSAYIFLLRGQKYRKAAISQPYLGCFLIASLSEANKINKNLSELCVSAVNYKKL